MGTCPKCKTPVRRRTGNIAKRKRGWEHRSCPRFSKARKYARFVAGVKRRVRLKMRKLKTQFPQKTEYALAS